MTSVSDTCSTTPRTTSPSAKFLKLTSYMSRSRSYSSSSIMGASCDSVSGLASITGLGPPMGAIERSVFSVSAMLRVQPPNFQDCPDDGNPSRGTRDRTKWRILDSLRAECQGSGRNGPGPRGPSGAAGHGLEAQVRAQG